MKIESARIVEGKLLLKGGDSVRFILSIILILIPSVCFSAPDKYTNYAMSTYVSLHDFGVYKVNNDLKGIYKVVNGEYTHSHYSNIITAQLVYDYDNNKYIINIYAAQSDEFDIAHINDLANELIEPVKNELGYFRHPNTKHYITPFGSSKLSSYMKHYGYEDKSRPEGTDKEIDKRLSIEIEILTKGNKKFYCTNEMESTTVLCSK